MEKLYLQLAEELSAAIAEGLYRPGERLPSVRALSRQRGVSIATVIAAYGCLQDKGLLEPHNRSGHYVRSSQVAASREPRTSRPPAMPQAVTGQQLVLSLVQAANNPDVVQLGAAVPDGSFLPVKAVGRAIAQVSRLQMAEVMGYEFPPGVLLLRRQIARRMAEMGCAVHPDDIVITNGCQEALTLALKAVTSPGDVVAIESPTFYGLLQVIESLGLEALEIPTHPRTGISLEALELALSRWPVKACVVVPNYSNPLGFCMPDDHKRQLVNKLKHYGIPLIEDDVYGDLGFGRERPSVCKAMADDDVFYCGSFAKTLSPGLRIGWLAAGRKYQGQLEYMKYVLNLATPTLPQLAVAELLDSGAYDRHLRQVKPAFAAAVARMTEAVLRHFPAQTSITRPEGGFVIWLELPEEVDALTLARQALAKNISIAPGPIFSASQKYRNFIRLSCGCAWSNRVEGAVATLAAML